MSFSIDFITYQPLCNGNNAIFTCFDRLTSISDLFLVLGGALSIYSVAQLFFYNVVRFFGIFAVVISVGHPTFTASFW